MKKERENKIALFPCKANPPHIGHITTLLRIKDDYDKIIIDILNANRIISTTDAIKIFKKILDNFPNKFEYATHETSYTISMKTLPLFFLCEFDTVVSGNKKIIEIFNKHGFETRYIERTPFYCGRTIREALSQKPRLSSINS